MLPRRLLCAQEQGANLLSQQGKQCGGPKWKGPTTCVPGYKCKKQGPTSKCIKA
jgi:hypothetical protein